MLRDLLYSIIIVSVMSEKQNHVYWREHLNNIEKMRSERNAPVDSMGCEQISDKSAAPEVSVAFCTGLLVYCAFARGNCTLSSALETVTARHSYGSP